MSFMKMMPLVALGIAGGVGAKAMKEGAEVVDKFQVAATQNVEIKGVAQAVAMHYTDNDPILPIDNFSEFLRENMRTADGQPPKRDPALDPWETPYVLFQVNQGFKVLSAGPDKLYETGDDLTHHFDLSGISDQPPQGSRAPRNYKQLVAKARAAAGSSDDKGKGDENAAPPSQKKPSSPEPSRAAKKKASRSKEAVADRVLKFQMKQADEGNARAQFVMAERYLYGEGVEYNPSLGMEYLNKAAANGYAKAKEKIASMDNATGIADQPDE